MPTISVSVDGSSLRDLQKALKKADGDVDKRLRGELKSAAGIVATAAKGKVPSVSGRAAGSIRAGATAKGAYVAGGKKAVPYYGWLDFGNRKANSGQPRSLGPWARTGKGPQFGRFIYPALDDNYDKVIDAVQTAVDRSIKEAGL